MQIGTLLIDMKLYEERIGRVITGFVLGILSVGLWLIPLAGILTSIACLFLSVQGLESRYSRLSLASLLLGGIGFVLTILRSLLVYYL